MLTHLFLRDFRCFSECRVDLHPRTTLLVGRNAQGKTSLMEAACVLLRLQSPRTAQRSDLIRLGASSLVVESTCHSQALRYAQSRTARRLAVENQVCGRAVDFLSASGPVVWMDHRDMSLLRGGAEFRRRYLDATASQLSPEYLKALRDYERALRGRNHVLKRDATIPWRQADAFAQVMDRCAHTLRHGRAELVQQLEPVAAEHHGLLSAGNEQLQLTYLPGYEQGSLVAELLARRDEELRSRTTAAGPHRDDLMVQLNGLAAATFASEGQQRSAALALKIAQASVIESRRGQAPLLLLDDVFGELDPGRRQALLAALPAQSQKIITTTTLSWADRALTADALLYEIQEARAVPLSAHSEPG